MERAAPVGSTARRRAAAKLVFGVDSMSANAMAGVLQPLFFRFLALGAVVGGSLLLAGERPAWHSASGAVALGLLMGYWYAGWRRGRFPTWAVPLECLVMLILVIAYDDPLMSLGVVYFAVYFRSLYGTATEALSLSGGYLAATLLAIVVWPALGWSEPSIVGTPVAVAQVVGLLMAMGIVRVLRNVALRQERHVDQQQLLAETGGLLAGADDRQAVAAAARDGAARLAAIATPAPVLVALRGEDRTLLVAASTEPGLVGTVLDWLVSGYGPGSERRLFAAIDADRAPVRWAAAAAHPLAANGSMAGVLVVGLDDPDLAVALRSLASQVGLALSRVQALDQLRASEARFRSLVANASDVFRVLDRDGVITSESEAVRQVLGYESASVVGRSMYDDLHPDDEPDLRLRLGSLVDEPSDRVEVTRCRVRHADGHWRHLECAMRNLLDDPAVSGVVVNYSDISEQVLLEEELRHRALHDSLTGLPNRELFLDRIDHAVRRLRRSGGLVGMLFVDLDGFKSVNDRFGHGAGDRVLEITADRLRAVSRGTDSCARFGGDEFGVLLEDLHDPAAAGGIARRIVDTLTEPMDLDGQVVMIGASVGIALGTGPEGAEELIHRADLAMYRAKTEGKGRTAVYDLAAESHR